jgi:hypothetical protein
MPPLPITVWAIAAEPNARKSGTAPREIAQRDATPVREDEREN